MRILDENTDQSLQDVLLLLTKKEAEEVRDVIDQLLKEDKYDHDHILDRSNYERQITVAIYDDVHMEQNLYTKRVMDLIAHDK